MSLNLYNFLHQSIILLVEFLIPRGLIEFVCILHTSDEELVYNKPPGLKVLGSENGTLCDQKSDYPRSH